MCNDSILITVLVNHAWLVYSVADARSVAPSDDMIVAQNVLDPVAILDKGSQRTAAAEYATRIEDVAAGRTQLDGSRLTRLMVCAPVGPNLPVAEESNQDRYEPPYSCLLYTSPSPRDA